LLPEHLSRDYRSTLHMFRTDTLSLLRISSLDGCHNLLHFRNALCCTSRLDQSHKAQQSNPVRRFFRSQEMETWQHFFLSLSLQQTIILSDKKTMCYNQYISEP